MKILYPVAIGIFSLFFVPNTLEAGVQGESALLQFVAVKSQQGQKPCTKRNRKNCRLSRPGPTSSSSLPSVSKSHASKAMESGEAQVSQNGPGGNECGRFIDYGEVAEDGVRFNDNGIDFGWSAWALGAASGNGRLDWLLGCGGLKPRLRGYLHMTDVAGWCSRMRIDYLTHAKTLMATRYSEEFCAQNNRHQSKYIYVWGYGHEKINAVKVVLERKDGSGFWKPLRDETYTLPTIHSVVKITEDGFDFGGNKFSLGSPTNKADVTFTWSGGKVTPHVKGTLYMNNVAGVCARMKIEYYRTTHTSDRPREEQFQFDEYGNTQDSYWHRVWDKSKYGGNRVCPQIIHCMHGSWISSRMGMNIWQVSWSRLKVRWADGSWAKVGSEEVAVCESA